MSHQEEQIDNCTNSGDILIPCEAIHCKTEIVDFDVSIEDKNESDVKEILPDEENSEKSTANIQQFQRVTATSAQLMCLLEFVELNCESSSNGLGETAYMRRKKWKALAEKLNAMGGKTTDYKGWQSLWRDWRYRVKRKANDKVTVPKKRRSLSEQDRKILELLGWNPATFKPQIGNSAAETSGAVAGTSVLKTSVLKTSTTVANGPAVAGTSALKTSTTVANVPATVANVPATVANIPATVANIPATVANVPATVANVPATIANVNATVAETSAVCAPVLNTMPAVVNTPAPALGAAQLQIQPDGTALVLMPFITLFGTVIQQTPFAQQLQVVANKLETAPVTTTIEKPVETVPTIPAIENPETVPTIIENSSEIVPTTIEKPETVSMIADDVVAQTIDAIRSEPVQPSDLGLETNEIVNDENVRSTFNARSTRRRKNNGSYTLVRQLIDRHKLAMEIEEDMRLLQERKTLALEKIAKSFQVMSAACRKYLDKRNSLTKNV